MRMPLRPHLWLGSAAAVVLAHLSACAPGQEGPFAGTWEASQPLYDVDDDSTSAPDPQPASGERRHLVQLFDDSTASVADADAASTLRGRWRYEALSGEICIEPAPDTSRHFNMVTRYAAYCGKATAESDGRARELQLASRPVGFTLDFTPRTVVLRRVE